MFAAPSDNSGGGGIVAWIGAEQYKPTAASITRCEFEFDENTNTLRWWNQYTSGSTQSTAQWNKNDTVYYWVCLG